MPHDPDATPEEKLQAWLAEQEASGAFRRPKRKARPVVNAIVLAISLAIWGLFGWALVRNVFG